VCLKKDSVPLSQQMTTESSLKSYKIQGVPKKMYTHRVNIPYYNVYTSSWDTLYKHIL
jgi:hypothetical protein